MPTGPGDHLALQLDVTQLKAAEDVIAAAQDKFGKPPSLLVNSAGVGVLSPFLDATEATLDRLMDINLKVGCFDSTPKVYLTCHFSDMTFSII